MKDQFKNSKRGSDTKDHLKKLKRSAERKYNNDDKKNMNVVYRRMKVGLTTVKEFLDMFPGNTFIDYRYNRKSPKELRKQINSKQ